jgi:hypothetical protein
MKTNTNDLKREAESIIKNLSLLEILSKYGDARVVGSVALNLIVKRDIDLHVVVKTDNLFEVVDQIYPTLLGEKGVTDIRIFDYREKGGIKVGIDSYSGLSGDWSIDLWVTNLPETTGFALADRLTQQLTNQQRKAILKIKKALHSRSELRDGISTQIYAAVVDNDVRTVIEFEEIIK